MKLKYAVDAVPLRKEQSGYTFQKPSGLKTALRSQANDRTRLTNQVNRKANLMAAVRHWRNLSVEEKAAWQTFAEAYPQPCKYSPSGFLSGYELFIKRQQYCFLNYGISDSWLTAPLSVELIPIAVDFAISGVHNVIDVTELYLRNFGLLPLPGQRLLFKCLPYAIESGQFFPVIESVLTVEEVYMDGLFISLSLPKPASGIVWSCYLSKPQSPGIKYSGTKTRYMGCFTSKTFLELGDAPSSYEGQAGKVVTVKEDESGLEFSEGGGGGLTCETLSECLVIISIDQAIANLQTVVMQSLSTSLPPVVYGNLYPPLTAFDARNLAPVGCHFPTNAEWLTIFNSLGGISLCCNPMREVGTTYWQIANTGATNAAKFNARGSGFVNGSTGVAGGFMDNTSIYCSSPFSVDARSTYIFRRSAAFVNQQGAASNFGYSARFIKDVTALVNGQSGAVTGNDGKVYRTICIAGLEIMADSSRETKFQNGDSISLAVNAAEWLALPNPKYAYSNYSVLNS